MGSVEVFARQGTKVLKQVVFNAAGRLNFAIMGLEVKYLRQYLVCRAKIIHAPLYEDIEIDREDVKKILHELQDMETLSFEGVEGPKDMGEWGLMDQEHIDFARRIISDLRQIAETALKTGAPMFVHLSP